jgi:hypothetical protein
VACPRQRGCCALPTCWHLRLQAATFHLLEVTLQASGDYWEHPKQEVLDALVHLMMYGVCWTTAYLTAPAVPLSVLQTCKEAVERGMLPDSAVSEESLSGMVVAMLYTCGEW